jgi:hypothetical protein
MACYLHILFRIIIDSGILSHVYIDGVSNDPILHLPKRDNITYIKTSTPSILNYKMFLDILK